MENDELYMVYPEPITDNEISSEYLSGALHSFTVELKIIRARF
ncbi:MAG: hypothetical protein AAE987_06940 [Thermoplasmataceae archaeon]